VQQQIQRSRPDWSPAWGICPACALHHARQHGASRQFQSLHTRTVPATTFPYYHPQETRILAQHERLPEHPGFSGQGVTVAFLDSGYFPHIDLLTQADLGQEENWSASGWPPGSKAAHIARSRRLLERLPIRIRQYVNLREDGVENTGLDSASLWSDADNSWHGQMTSAVGIGNGLLSRGLYRGFAPGADGVLLKIGRFNGSIPESEILRGLRWLLRDRHWERYGVRVVNVSVGGDYPDPWWESATCLAVEHLAREGVLVVVAAGNSGRNHLLAPAQAPSALTVGGVDDANRPWRRDRLEDINRLGLYHHNWGEVYVDHWRIPKPEILAPSIWIPAPILPVSPLYREVWLLGTAWQMMEAGQVAGVRDFLWEWHVVLGLEESIREAEAEQIRHILRFRMNPHKVAHPHYQHVDGTSVSAPQVAAVAAQMFQVNPSLSAYRAKELIMNTALPLHHLDPARTGAGLLQPSSAVALAQRDGGGQLRGLPVSATKVAESMLPDLPIPSKVMTESDAAGHTVPIYLGIHAGEASSVSLVGSFNGWQPGRLPLYKARGDWWHGVFLLPPGVHSYRFWITDSAGRGHWHFDHENPVREESGYASPHSSITVA
jgi:serine protease AprX